MNGDIMTTRKAQLTVDPSKRTVTVKANFTLGLPENKRLERGNYGFHPLRDSYNDDGKALAKDLMSDEAPDGWLEMRCHNAYSFTMTWHDMFEQDDMVALLVGELHRLYGITLQLDMNIVEPEPATVPASTIPPGDMDHTA
jgi:hypothetical protein